MKSDPKLWALIHEDGKDPAICTCNDYADANIGLNMSKIGKKIYPNKLTHRKPLYSFEFENFFMRPFKGKRDYIEDVGYCLSLYTVSTPQISDYEKGGLNSALLSRDRQWKAVK
jgi:hypothetical protein